jgi:hypothetical protein
MRRAPRRPQATATMLFPPAVRAPDSAAKVPVEAQEVADPVLVVTDSLALVFRLENRFYCSGLP